MPHDRAAESLTCLAFGYCKYFKLSSKQILILFPFPARGRVTDGLRFTIPR